MLNYVKAGKVPFSKTLQMQELQRQAIINVKNGLEMPMPHTLFSFEVAHPTYTFGRRYQQKVDLNLKTKLEQFSDVVELKRGGHATFHGPGQLMMYPVLDLNSLKIRVRDYVCILEKSIVLTLQKLGIKAEQRPGVGLNGVWIENTNKKVAFVGISASRNVTQFGISMNVNVDDFYFKQITPCNLTGIETPNLKDFVDIEINELSDLLANELALKLNLELTKSPR